MPHLRFAQRGVSLCAAVVFLAPGVASAQAVPPSAAPAPADPRVGLRAGWLTAGEAISHLEHVAFVPRPAAFVDTTDPGNFQFINADLAFRGDLVFQGGYHGFQVWDISTPSAPRLRLAFPCPGGQGDLSIHGNLLFMSVEETRARIDCGAQGVSDTVSAERFRGVRIFDISDLDHPRQVAAVQTCRGSHTHTLVSDPADRKNIYVYVSGTSVVRSPNELAGCSPQRPEKDPNTSLFRIDVIRVPLARPQDARVIASPRVFADSTGVVNALWKGGAHGEGTQTTAETNMCHDITVYSAIGLAAGACSGNGILLDIRRPAAPVRVAAVSDPNFAYWHSATFNNDGTTVIYTDEWGGGTQPRCRVTDRPLWGADALFTLRGRTLTPAGYFKLPAAQTESENCVAHNGNLIPVPGRDIMVQAWYQGGLSVFDFTDPAHPQEIAYFDRGPVDSTRLVLAGYWSAYWYNGHIVGSEIARGLDIFHLTPSTHLSPNEIEAALSARVDYLNPQDQRRIVWPASFAVARSYLDQLVRGNGLASVHTDLIAKQLDRAEQLRGAARRSALRATASTVDRHARQASDPTRVRALAAAVRALARR